jgi:hypothetical protein
MMYVACTESYTGENGTFEEKRIYFSDGYNWVNVTSEIEFDMGIFPDGPISDENLDPLLDESNDPFYDENSEELIVGYKDKKIGAERSKCDKYGNIIDETYLRKDELIEMTDQEVSDLLGSLS